MILSHLLLKALYKCHIMCMTTHQSNVGNIVLPSEFVQDFFLLDTQMLYTQTRSASLSAEVPKTFYQALFSSEGHSVISLGTSSSARVSEVKARATQGSELPAAPAHSRLQTRQTLTKAEEVRMSQEEAKLEESSAGPRPQLTLACLWMC